MSSFPLGRIPALATALVLLAPTTRAQYDSPFMQEYRKLMVIKADDEMATLMRKNEASAILSIIDVCETIGKGSSDQLEAEVDALGRIWKKIYGTRFVEIDHAIQPKLGMAVLWNNLLEYGTPNQATRHAGEPVTQGHKVIITKCFRVFGDGPLYFS